MTDTTITTWAIAADRDGAPFISATDPNEEEARSALALVRLNPVAKRYTVEPIGITDHGFAARLARETIALAFQGGAEWQRVRPADLAPREPAEAPQPERLDRGAITPAHPRWAAEAAALLECGYPDPEAREAARARLIPAALAGAWTLRELGHAILRERAEATDAAHASPLHHVGDEQIAAALIGEDRSAAVWAKVQRAPAPNEVTNATRRTF